jgi:hypothetical protein
MPKTIVVEGANSIDNDNSTKDNFTVIATLTGDVLPHENNQNIDFVSSKLGSASTPYRYLRFRVTEIWRGADTGDVKDDNGYPFFTMAKFGLTKASYATISIKDEFLNSNVTEELLASTYNEIDDAITMKETTSSVALLNAQITNLTAAKTTLEEAMAQQSGLDKTALRELIADMQCLLGEVADKTTAKTALALQTTDANADFYIWSNAKASDCDGIGASALIDKNDDGTAKPVHSLVLYGKVVQFQITAIILQWI